MPRLLPGGGFDYLYNKNRTLDAYGCDFLANVAFSNQIMKTS
jgi:hypothetical protein